MYRTLSWTALLLAIAGAASGQTATLYEHHGYSGKRVRISGRGGALEPGWNDRTSSVRITGGTWELCRHYGYVDCRMIAQDVADLRSIGFNDALSSLRPVASGPPVLPRSPSRAREVDAPRSGRDRRRTEAEAAPSRRAPKLSRGDDDE
jgi:hypothetical protein